MQDQSITQNQEIWIPNTPLKPIRERFNVPSSSSSSSSNSMGSVSLSTEGITKSNLVLPDTDRIGLYIQQDSLVEESRGILCDFPGKFPDFSNGYDLSNLATDTVSRETEKEVALEGNPSMANGLRDFFFQDLNISSQFESSDIFTQKFDIEASVTASAVYDDTNNRDYHEESKYEQGCGEKERAEICVVSANEKQYNGLEIPEISTPLQETKRKRKNDDMESERKRSKKTRKKMYRPKVIGQGRRQKSKGLGTPEVTKDKLAPSKPKTPNPVTPKRPSSKLRTRKLANPKKNPAKRDLNFDEVDEKLGMETKSTAAAVFNFQLQSEMHTPESGISNGECESNCGILVEIEATKSVEDGYGNQSNSFPVYQRGSKLNCRNLVEIDAMKSVEDDSGIQSNSFLVYQRRSKLNGWLHNEHFPRLEIPKGCKKKRTSRRRKINKFSNLKGWISMVEEGQCCKSSFDSSITGLSNNKILEIRKGSKSRTKKGKGKGLSCKLPSFIIRRKRTVMVRTRRCNFAALSALPFLKQSESEKDENFSGDDNGGGRMAQRIASCSSTENEEGMQIKGLAQMALSPASLQFSNLQTVGTLWETRDFSHTEKLSNNITMGWLDIGHFLTNSKFLNGRREKSPSEKGSARTSIVSASGLHDVDSKGILIKQQQFTIAARSSGHMRIVTRNVIEMRSTLDNLILLNRSQGTMDYHEHIGLTGEPRVHDVGSQEEESGSSQERLLIPFPANCYYQEPQLRLVPNYEGTNCSTGLSHDDKERTGSSKEKQMIRYARERQNQTLQLSVLSGQDIVPYHKPTKKRHELDKVYLDQRNVTMWNLLIKNEGNFGKEKVDINTEKWWEYEREVFRGRIDAFIARLHPILGDRRFLPWKGSVVDSVVGVYLTQNVSDNLSSSAFMSLAATFPLQSTSNDTENYGCQEIVCYQDSIVRNEKSFECESKLNNGSRLENKTIDLEVAEELSTVVCIQDSMVSNKGSFECESKLINGHRLENKTTVDLEADEELTSAIDGTASQDFQMSSSKQSTDGTQFFSSTCREEISRICGSSNLETTGDTVLQSNKSTFVEGLYSGRTSTLSCECNQENEILESKEMDYRNGNPTSENLNQRDATHMLRSFEKCHLCPECSSQSKSGLESNSKSYNCCQGTLGVDFQFTPDVEYKKLHDGVGKVQSREIQATCDANGKCCLSSECRSQRERGIEKKIKFYNFLEGKADDGPLLLPIDESYELLVAGVEKVENQERKIQTLNNAHCSKKKGKQQNLEGKCSCHVDEKKTEIPKEKTKKIKTKPEIDWDGLQKKWDTMRGAYSSCEPRNNDYMDSVNWEAVRCAEPSKIAEAIKERGQHNIIAARIKEFLDRVSRIHGSIDLEWLRNAPPHDVKEYLLEINGLGLKSVECIRLLALQQVAFPVDINVGRIAVRLGWVPLEPLPEEVEMHLLEMFPMMDSIQKYLWPRLCTLDQRTLYELHYQLITFGKVFCTKRNPNCNACPLKAECRHYASALARARFALPGPAEKRMVPVEVSAQTMNPESTLLLEDNPLLGSSCPTNNYEPIIEEPLSPEPEYDESSLIDIEDICNYDSNDIPTIRLDAASQNCMEVENKMLQDLNTIRDLVPLNIKVASIPTRKLKHINRLRTEHQVYELPDAHPLLFELDRREQNDSSPYLLLILTPGEMVNSSEPPNTKCLYQESGKLCSEETCSSCNIIREQNSGTIRGTILIPCRTAMRGVFPLNGTYFQVNEVFADDESSRNPIHIPREWIWNLPRRTAYFGTSTSTIFRGLSTDEIQYCFQRGFICVRGFDRKTRKPKRLIQRLHKPTTSIPAGKAKANRMEDRGKN